MLEISAWVRFVFMKADAPMLRTAAGIVKMVRLVQFWKAPTPMLVMPLAILTAFSRVQSLKVLSLMATTFLGMVTLVRLAQPLKADWPISLTVA